MRVLLLLLLIAALAALLWGTFLLFIAWLTRD